MPAKYTSPDTSAWRTVVALDPAHDAEVQLHERRPELEDVAEAGVPRARIVDGESNAAAIGREGTPQPLVVLDPGVLGELEDDRLLGEGK